MASTSRTRNSSRNALTGVLSQCLVIVLKFVCRTVFIQSLGVQYLGINGLFSNILSLLSIAELGFDTAITFRLYKPVKEADVDAVQKYLVFFKQVYYIIGGVIFVLGLLIIPFLSFFIKDYESLDALGINASFLFLLFLAQNVSTYFFYAYRSVVLRVHQEQYKLDLVKIIITILSCLSQIVVLAFLKDFIAYVICITLFNVLENIANGILSKRLYPAYFKKNENRLVRSEKIELFKDCAALFVYKVNGVVMKATDSLVLSSMIGLAIVGYYSNYVIIIGSVSGILLKCLAAAKDSIGNLFVSDTVEKKYFIFEVMNYIVVIAYGTAGLCIAIGSNYFISCWLGEEFIIPQPFPILLGIELLLTGLKQNLAQMRHVSGIFQQMWFRPVLGSIINVVSSIILVRFWGISGVICGTILAAIFANLIIDPALIHKYSFDNIHKPSYYYKKNGLFLLVLFGVSLLDFYACKVLLPNHNIGSLFGVLLIVMITVPATFILVFKNRPECKYVVSKIVNLKRKIV